MHRAILATADQRYVESDDVALACNLVNRAEIATIGTLARRVATQHTETPSTTILLDQTPDIAHADNAQTMVGRTTTIALANALQRRRNPLQHSARVAPRGSRHLDVVSATIVQIDMVVTDCGGGDHTNFRAVKQCSITLRAGANDQGVAIAHRRGIEPLARKVLHLSIRLENARNERNSAIDCDFHICKGMKN